MELIPVARENETIAGVALPGANKKAHRVRLSLSFSDPASTSNREYWDAALTRNEILERSGIAMAAFAILKLGDRYRDPIPFTVIPPTSREQHRMLSKTPIPPAIEPTRVVSELSHDRSPREKRSAGNPKTEKAIHELIDAIKQEEVWEIET